MRSVPVTYGRYKLVLHPLSSTTWRTPTIHHIPGAHGTKVFENVRIGLNSISGTINSISRQKPVDISQVIIPVQTPAAYTDFGTPHSKYYINNYWRRGLTAWNPISSACWILDPCTTWKTFFPVHLTSPVHFSLDRFGLRPCFAWIYTSTQGRYLLLKLYETRFNYMIVAVILIILLLLYAIILLKLLGCICKKAFLQHKAAYMFFRYFTMRTLTVETFFEIL